MYLKGCAGDNELLNLGEAVMMNITTLLVVILQHDNAARSHRRSLDCQTVNNLSMGHFITSVLLTRHYTIPLLPFSLITKQTKIAISD